MAFEIIPTAGVPEWREVQSLQLTLETAYQRAERLQRRIVEMDDAEVTAQYGIPTAFVASFRTMVDNVVTGLSSASVQTLLNQVGFDA